MDNFAAWVDAPTEALIPTPIDDDSSDFLRDEILQTQQFVIDKLDEQKNSEKEASDRTGKESELMRKHKDVMNGESERSEISRVLLVELQKSIRSTDMRLMSMKKKFPVTEPLRETYYKEISELNFSISALARNFTGRENEVKKIVQSAVSLNNKSAEASNLKKLRNSILEAKQKHEKLIAIKKSIRELRAKSQLVHWNVKESPKKGRSNCKDEFRKYVASFAKKKSASGTAKKIYVDRKCMHR
uniref:Uncharacterized protein n=1 Tax=Caenorhabditis japonica TaxID=281687 RepID=A0A8R1IWW1_CAEJA